MVSGEKVIGKFLVFTQFSPTSVRAKIVTSSDLKTKFLSNYSHKEMNETFVKIKAIVDEYSSLWDDMTAIANERTNFEDILSIDEQVEELKTFLVLKAIARDVHDSRLSASNSIMTLWQILASFTREYPVLCNAMLPEDVEVRMIHCKPHLLCGPSKTDYETRYSTTYAMYKEVLGRHPPRDVWHKPASSSSPHQSSSQEKIVEDLTDS